MHRKRIPNYHTLKYSISPLSLYNAFVVHSAINNICESALASMDYGEYMDTGDALGYDDIEPYNYGYSETLEGIFSTIGTFLGKVGKGIGSVASKTWQFTSKYAVKGFDMTKKFASTGWTFVKKLPAIGKKAVSWTYGKVIKPTAQWSVGAVKDVYKWTGWKKIGNRAFKIISGTVSAGLQLVDTLGQAFIMTAGGQIYPAPAGTTPAPQEKPQPTYTPAPDETIYPAQPQPNIEYVQSPDTGEYLPVNIDSGWVVDPATGQPVREATEAELTLAKNKKKNIWWYIVGGLGIASLLI